MRKLGTTFKIGLVAIVSCAAIGLVTASRRPASPANAGSSAPAEHVERPVATVASARERTEPPSRTPSPVVSAARSEQSELERGLASDNPFERLKAMNEAADRGLVEALPLLEKRSLVADPDTALALIGTIGELAEEAGGEAREHAVGTLTRWLDEQSVRGDARDARGNVSAIVETLGTLRSPSAVNALASALDRQRLPLHVETVAVQGLFDLGDARALEAVERFGKRLEALPSTDSAFERALRDEASVAVRAAERRLGS